MVKSKMFRTHQPSGEVEFFHFKGFTIKTVQSAYSPLWRPEQTSTLNECGLSGFLFLNSMTIKERNNKILQLFLEKHSNKEIAKKLRVSYTTVGNVLLQEYGFCNAQRQFYKTRFTPKYKGLTTFQRFWLYVEKGNDNECWEWQGHIKPNGYGRFFFFTKSEYAHRVSFIIANRILPKNMVLHSCDNRKCVNPNHLREGSAKDNAQDRTERNRLDYKKVVETRRKNKGLIRAFTIPSATLRFLDSYAQSGGL